jgi:hypothetical protein
MSQRQYECTLLKTELHKKKSPATMIGSVIKAIGNNEERKRNHSTETQDFNVENPLQQREVKTTGASQQNFTISGVCLQTPWAIL